MNTDVKINVIGDSTNNENSHNEHITVYKTNFKINLLQDSVILMRRLI